MATHIAIVLAAADVPANVLAGLRKLTEATLSELKDWIARRQPVLMLPLFDNQFHESGAATACVVVDFLDSNGRLLRSTNWLKASVSRPATKTSAASHSTI